MPLMMATLLTAEELTALRLSLIVGLCAVAISLPVALPIAYALARRSFPGKWIIEALLDLPLVLPPVVTGYLLLILFSPRRPVGWFFQEVLHLPIAFHWRGAAVAAAVVSFPLLVRSIRLAFQAVDPRLELAARSLGAGPWDCFFSISLPLAKTGVIAGCLLAFARSLGEFGATIMIAANIAGETRTIPLAIFSAANQPNGMPATWRLVGLSVFLACAALGLSELLERRGSLSSHGKTDG